MKDEIKISKFRLITAFIFGGGFCGIIKYSLDVLKRALDGLTNTTRTKIQAALNLSMKVLSILEAVKCFVPTKWQTAYKKTIEAIAVAVDSLSDLDLTTDEFDIICDRVTEAIDAWESPDDETCVD